MLAGRPFIENAMVSPAAEAELIFTGTFIVVPCSTVHPVVREHGDIGVSMAIVKSNGAVTVSAYVAVGDGAVFVIEEETPATVIVYVPGVMVLEVDTLIVFEHVACNAPSVHVPKKFTEIEPAAGTEENAPGFVVEVKFEKLTASVPAKPPPHVPLIVAVLPFPWNTASLAGLADRE